MANAFWFAALALAASVALVMIGAVTAWAAANAAKRLAGATIALIGAVLALGALGAPPALLVAGVALTFAHLTLGLALLVRLQEGYGGVESTEIDAADRKAEAAERET
jgi:hypothetical protein